MGMNATTNVVKANIRSIHSRVVASGEIQQSNNSVSSPSAKFSNIFKRYPTVSTHSSAERVDRGHINMASEHTISSYFKLLLGTLVKYNIIQLDTDGNLIQESLQGHKIYLADETGWGIMSSKKPVVARKGAKHVFTRKANDETHKTLMLGGLWKWRCIETINYLTAVFSPPWVW